MSQNSGGAPWPVCRSWLLYNYNNGCPAKFQCPQSKSCWCVHWNLSYPKHAHHCPPTADGPNFAVVELATSRVWDMLILLLCTVHEHKCQSKPHRKHLDHSLKTHKSIKKIQLIIYLLVFWIVMWIMSINLHHHHHLHGTIHSAHQEPLTIPHQTLYMLHCTPVLFGSRPLRQYTLLSRV